MSNQNNQAEDMLLVRIHIGANQEAWIKISPHSDVDSVIQQCIDRHRLKKEAHGFLKAQIEPAIKNSNTTKRLKTEVICTEKQPPLFSPMRALPLRKDHSYIKSVNMDRKNTNLELTDRIQIDKKCKLKTNNLKTKDVSQLSAKIYLKRKAQSQKQNVQIEPISKVKQRKTSQIEQTKLGQCTIKRKPKQSACNQSVVIKNDSQITKDSFGYLEIGHLIKPLRLMTQPCQSHKMKEFSFTDLEVEMNKQVADLKIEKKIQRLQPQLCNLFRSIIRYNPPKINKIDPRYACFEDLSEKVIKGLHQFLRQLQENELNCLDFDNFKKLLVKYKAVDLLASLK